MTADNVIPLVPTDTLDRALIAELRHAAESLTRRGIDATWIDLDELRALLRAADERDALAERLERITAPTSEIMPIAAEPDDEPDTLEEGRAYVCYLCSEPIKADGRTLWGWRHALISPKLNARIHSPQPLEVNGFRVTTKMPRA